MNARRRWRRPTAFAVALTLIGIAVFARLGVWQIDRAKAAQALLDAFAGAVAAPVEDFAAVRAQPPADRFPHVRVRGRFVADRGWLRDEQARAGRLGVEAYAAFAPAGSEATLLVDRGWIAAPAAGQTPALPPLPDGEVELTGIYAPYPGSGVRVGGDALRRQKEWPKLTLAIDRGEIGADLGQALLPRVLLLDADPASGFERQWTPAVMPPERHRAYAFQWFAFIVAALAIFVARHWKKVET